MLIKEFVFNPFQENTYVLYDDSMQCVIIDAGCYDKGEENEMASFIEDKKLNPVALLNTHCHLDHIFGNAFVFNHYKLSPMFHELELPVLESAPRICELYGLSMLPSPAGQPVLKDNNYFKFGNTELKMILVPGHSPGSICFYNEKDLTLIGGDVLFQGSVGRTDLPGGDAHTLFSSIRQRLFVLPDEVTVYPGHGPQTTIGYEKLYNPYLTDAASFTS